MSRFYTVSQTAKILGFSTNSIYKFLEEKRLHSTRGNSKQGRFRIPHSSIEDFLGTKLPEDAVAAALAATKRKNIKKPLPKVEPKLTLPPLQFEKPTKQDHSDAPYGASQTITRLLIIVCLVFTIIEAIVSKDLTLISQLWRLLVLIIAILLAYQSGGTSEDPLQ